jgi:hypothetical protein
MDRVFMYLLSGMVFKRLVLPESGLIYEITQGVLTGHSFTSIVTTLSAYFTLSTSVMLSTKKADLYKTGLQGAGDDWIGKFINSSLPKLDYIINNVSGHTADSLEKAKGCLTDVYPNKFPTFLKKHYIHGFIAWNVNELFINLSYPRSRKMKLRQRIYDLIVMSVSAPFNPMLNNCLRKLIIYNIIDVYTKGRYGYSERSRNLTKIYEDVYDVLLYERNFSKILDKVPRALHLSSMEMISGKLNEVDVRSLCEFYLSEFDRRVNKSKRWMLRPTIFPMLESVRRLKVFDTNKINFKLLFPIKRTNFTANLY